MEYAAFQRRAERLWEEIPDEYRSGVDGLVLEREPRPHPTLPDIYTLGECLTESYISDWAGPETTRSVLVLYYGSFVRLSELDPEFDWRYEIWETITHELRHHLESLAAEDALEDVDYAVDENFRRLNGEPFDPFFFRSGEPLAPGVYQADRDVFIERRIRASDALPDEVAFDWEGVRYVIRMPDGIGDVTFLQDTGGIGARDGLAVCLVLVREYGLRASIRRWLRRQKPVVAAQDVTARRL